MGLLRFSFLMALLLSCGGCATGHLWKESRLASFNEPALDPQLEIFEVPPQNDFLAVYNELRANDQVRRRAYFLCANKTRTDAARKPQFVQVPDLPSLKKVTIFPPGQNVIATRGQAAVRMLGARQFVLQIGEDDVGHFDLPVYKDALSTSEQVLVTPLAVSIDATVVGGAIFVWSVAHGAGPFWQCLFNGH